MYKNSTIVIATDGLDFFAECTALFENHDIQTIKSSNDGNSLIELIISKVPDMVLMDVIMPHCDAVTVVKKVKEALKPEQTPLFFAMSSFHSPLLEKDLRSNCIDYFFLQPVETDLIVDRIALLFNTNNNSSIESGFLNPDKPDVEIMVTDIIHQIGVPAHIKGYHYLRDSIILVLNEPQMINSVTKKLYTTVATNNETTPSRVERAIRHAIEVAWDRGDIDILNSYFSYTVHNQRGKPTNSEFIAMISDQLRLSLRNIN